MAFSSNGGWFPYTRTRMDNGTLDFSSASKKAIIVETAPDGTEDFVDDLDEYSGTNYVGGYGGSGRKAMTSGSFAFDTDVSDIQSMLSTLSYGLTTAWTSLGTNGNVIAGIVIITETGGSDATAIPWIWIPFNGGSYTLTGGNQTFTYPDPIAAINHAGAT